MGIRPHQRIWICQCSSVGFRQKYHRGEVFEIDLVHDAGIRWHHAKSVERRLAPLEELVALAIALELQSDVLLEGAPQTIGIHLHGVVDHQIHRLQGIDPRGVAAHA